MRLFQRVVPKAWRRQPPAPTHTHCTNAAGELSEEQNEACSFTALYGNLAKIGNTLARNQLMVFSFGSVKCNGPETLGNRSDNELLILDHRRC